MAISNFKQFQWVNANQKSKLHTTKNSYIKLSKRISEIDLPLKI